MMLNPVIHIYPLKTVNFPNKHKGSEGNNGQISSINLDALFLKFKDMIKTFRTRTSTNYTTLLSQKQNKSMLHLTVRADCLALSQDNLSYVVE